MAMQDGGRQSPEGRPSRHGEVIEWGPNYDTVVPAAVRLAVSWTLRGHAAPPDVAGATVAAQTSSDINERTRAHKHVDGWTDAHAGAARICAAADMCFPYLVMYEGDGDGMSRPWDPDMPRSTERMAVITVQMKNGDLVDVNGRYLRADWAASPQKSSMDVGRCSTGFGVMRTSEGLRAHPFCCHTGLCPVCARSKAADTVKRWLPAVMAIKEAGCTLVHITLTQPQFDCGDDDLSPVSLNPFERTTRNTGTIRGKDGADIRVQGRYLVRSEIGPDDVHHAAVPGESLASSRDRLYAAWRMLRNGGGRHRNAWKSSTFAAIHGIETTGRVWDKRQFGWRLRWHTHLHALVALNPGVDAHEWWRGIQLRWAQVTAKCSGMAASPDAQRCRVIVETSEDDIRRNVAETLKYPVKLGELTDAQLCEYLAVFKGTKNHWGTGAFHTTDKRGAAARVVMRGIQAGEDPEFIVAGLDLEADDRPLVLALGRAMDASEDDAPEVLHEWCPDEAQAGAEAVTEHDGSVSYWRPLTVSSLARSCESAVSGGALPRPLLIRCLQRGYSDETLGEEPVQTVTWDTPTLLDPLQLLTELTKWRVRGRSDAPKGANDA